MLTTPGALHPVTLKINNKDHQYSVAVATTANWEDQLHFMVVLNKKGKSVYRGKSNGNRVAILVNHLYNQGMTCYVSHAGLEYIYIPGSDIFVSRTNKKVCWINKDNPQRKLLVKKALDIFLEDQ